MTHYKKWSQSVYIIVIVYDAVSPVDFSFTSNVNRLRTDRPLSDTNFNGP